MDAKPYAGWVDAALLENSEETDSLSICDICTGVIVDGVSGFPEGHTFCRACLQREIR